MLQQAARLQEVTLSGNLGAVAGLCAYEEPFVAACAARARTLAPHMSLRSAATTLWALGRLRYRDDELMRRLAAVVTSHIEALDGTQPSQGAADAPPPRSARPRAQAQPRRRGGVLAEVASQRRLTAEWSGVEDATTAPSGPARDAILADGQCLSMALHACATLGAFDTPEAARMGRGALRYIVRHRRTLTSQTLVNSAWAATVMGVHTDQGAIGPVVLEALVRSHELSPEELAQLAQVDAALALEAPWYTGSEWLEDGNHYELLLGLYHLGANRCADILCTMEMRKCAFLTL